MKLIAQNFLGLQRVEWEPDGVCLVVGPNGSGKTSLLRAFSFLQAVFAASVPRAVTLLGGARGLKRIGAGDDEPVLLALEAADLRWELELIVQGGAVAEFPGERLYVGGELVVRRTPLSNEWSIETERIVDRLEDEPVSCLRAAWERRGQPARWRPIIEAVRGSRIYDQKWSVPHLWESALPSNTDLTLVPNGRNLFSVLRNWRAEPRRYGGQYEWVREKARLAFYDIFDDLEIGTQNDQVSVQYFAPGSDEGLPVRRAADGLIVGLLHLTAVASARLRTLVMLDEMENQLHPHAIRVILAAMRELAEERDLTVVLTTHSPVLMNEFKGDLERFFVTEPGRDRLPVRLDELHDPRYLAQFALGDLFERLKIGAPAPAQDSAAELDDVRVALIPTGDMELLGLRDCLARLFPGHDFEAVPSVPGRPGVRAEPFSQSFTARHQAETADVPTTLAKLIQELAGQVYPRRRDAADLAMVVDDLELFNLDEGQPEAVVGAIRQAVREHVKSALISPIDKNELGRELRERASFHLAVPMTEAWFFADARSIARNGVPADRVPRLLASVDPESFETADLAYSADDGAACAMIADRNRRRGESRRAPWIRAPQPEAPLFVRERHPKAYLQWLCRDPDDNWCTSWRESKAGADALRSLDWNAVLANPRHCAYARALVDDLADALDEPRPFADGGVLAPLTARKPRRQAAVLRNV